MRRSSLRGVPWASAAENLRQNRNFYQAGTAPLTDLLDAETLYTRSRNDFTSACAAYRTSLARYMRVTGRWKKALPNAAGLFRVGHSTNRRVTRQRCMSHTVSQLTAKAPQAISAMRTSAGRPGIRCTRS